MVAIVDPDENLKQLLEVASDVKEIFDNPNGDEDTLSEDQGIEVELHAERMSELVLALDGWIKGGGFLPKRWAR
jgi:hypothetical protein